MNLCSSGGGGRRSRGSPFYCGWRQTHKCLTHWGAWRNPLTLGKWIMDHCRRQCLLEDQSSRRHGWIIIPPSPLQWADTLEWSNNKICRSSPQLSGCFPLELGRSILKSILGCDRGQFGIGRKLRLSEGMWQGVFEMAQSWHPLTKLLMSLAIFGHLVWLAPGWPVPKEKSEDWIKLSCCDLGTYVPRL